MKNLKQFVLTVLLALASCVSAFAYDFGVDGIYYNVISMSELTCEVTSDDVDLVPYSGDVVIPSSVTYNGRTFTITKIGKHAFSNCPSLTSVVIGNSVSEIGDWSFCSCENLKSIEIPNSVTSLGNYAFAGCSNLKSVVIGISVTKIGEHVFDSCSGLASVVIPDSVTEIGNSMFNDCSSLTSMVIPSSVTKIGEGAFYGCTGLTSVVIPNSVSEIKWNTFNGCSSLTTVVIGNSVKSIKNSAFIYCSNLAEITSLNTTPPSVYSGSFEGVPKTKCVLKVPDESVDAYKTAEFWSAFWNIVSLNGSGGETPETKQCEAPVITFADGKIVAKSATEGAKCYTSITSEDFKGVDVNEPIELTGVYKTTSYAHAEGYKNSETATKEIKIMGDIVTNTVEVHDTIYIYDDSRSDIALADGTKCTLYVQDGVIYIADAPSGTPITVCDLSGKEVAVMKAEEFVTKIELSRDNVYIINVGGTEFKIKI